MTTPTSKQLAAAQEAADLRTKRTIELWQK